MCDPIDGSPPGSPVPGILQARTLEWVAISFSNAWRWKVKVKSLSCIQLLATPSTAAYQASLSMGFFRQEYWSGVPLPSPKGDWGNTYSHGTKSQGRGNSRLANMPRRDLLLSTFFLCPSDNLTACKENMLNMLHPQFKLRPVWKEENWPGTHPLGKPPSVSQGPSFIPLWREVYVT